MFDLAIDNDCRNCSKKMHVYMKNNLKNIMKELKLYQLIKNHFHLI